MSRTREVNSAARRLASTWLWPRYIGSATARRGMARAAAAVHGVLLDVGCGTRRHEDLLAKRAERYIGLDWPAPGFTANPDIIGDALHLPIASGSVDTVVATELLEHLPEPPQFLREVRRVLRPGGCVVLSVPLMEPLHEEPRDFYRFTSYGVRELLERHGFVVLSMHTKGGFWSVVIGSLCSQALYEAITPATVGGRRRYHLLTPFAVIACAALQLAGYNLDKLSRSTKYALGYVAIARRP